MAPRHHWLERPATHRALRQGAVLLLFALVITGFVWPDHIYFGFDGWPAFAAVFGFAAAAAIIVLAKLVLSPLLKRRDDFYDDA